MALKPTRVSLKIKERAMEGPSYTWKPVTYTVTGSSGELKSRMPESAEELRLMNLSLYHRAIKQLPSLREEYVLPFTEDALVNAIRYKFEKYKDTSDLRIAAVLHHRGKLELEEVEQSLKTSTEVFNIIREGEELSIARKKQAQMSKYPGDEKTKKLLQLKSWHESGMVPRSVTTWDQFLYWREEETRKFETFATESGLFSAQDLDENKKRASTSCSIM
eukprot:CAMPEP_0113960420 /NCGR_PEP_ID=MMETSP0011_2-20120614/4701_1 /TAXON_ID=101924 /ORGANISM="Rhodosorus marinus" /LENGTH=218 /DNA_ID=CAMNT_0000971863 /DNA_START=78 /DNA_END=734 /DNA_ORIENTATION=- /assembly_acc=CAM_ASM_000156